MAQIKKTLTAKFRLKLKKVGKTTRPFRYDLNQPLKIMQWKWQTESKGLDLIDRMPEELRTEVCDIIQESVTNTIPKEKEMQKGKMFAWEGLTNSWEKKKS